VLCFDLGPHRREPLRSHERVEREALGSDVGLRLQRLHELGEGALGDAAGLVAAVPLLLALAVLAVSDVDDGVPEGLLLAAPSLPLPLVDVTSHGLPPRS
jgi:hypothetical protein